MTTNVISLVNVKALEQAATGSRLEIDIGGKRLVCQVLEILDNNKSHLKDEPETLRDVIDFRIKEKDISPMTRDEIYDRS